MCANDDDDAAAATTNINHRFLNRLRNDLKCVELDVKNPTIPLYPRFSLTGCLTYFLTVMYPMGL